MSSRKENVLGTMPVGSLLVHMSLPMMISFFIQALYNIVDSIFVARISENALTAVSLALPMQMASHAIAVGIGVGINASVPRAIGQNRQDKARQIIGTAVLLCLLFTGLFILLGLTLSHEIYVLQTDVEEIITGGTVYLSIIWMVSAGEFFGQLFEKILTATAHPLQAMLSQAAGAVFNLIFDPLLIFGIGIFPRMGIAGAAAATVGGQIFAAVLAILLHTRLNPSLVIHPTDLRISSEAVKDILSVGFPSMVTIGLSSLSGFLINQILLAYSTTATAVYGIWAKLQNFCFMPVFGMNNGLVPILSYNYSARHNERVNEAFHLAFRFILILEVSLTIVLSLIPGPLLNLFSASAHMKAIGITALRICLLSLPFGGMTIIMTTAMQSLQHASYALINNILRQFVFLYFLALLFSTLTRQLTIVWWAIPIAELFSCLTAFLFTRKMKKDLRL